jgi:CRP/FNR family transcriptional regulator
VARGEATRNETIDIHRFQHLPREVMDGVAPRLRRLEIKRNQILFLEGRPFTHAFFIERGFFKVLKTGKGPVPAFLTVEGPQVCLGEFAPFNGMAYPVTAVALTDAVVVACEAGDFLEMSRESREFAEETATHLYQRLSHVNQRVANLAFGDARSRALEFFTFLAGHCGELVAGGAVWIPFVLKRGELASAINVTEETMIRLMAQLKREGLVVTERDGFHLRPGFFSAGKSSRSPNERRVRRETRKPEGARPRR